MAQLDNQTKVNVTTSYFGQGGGSSNLNASTLTLTAGNTSTILETYPGVGRLQTYVDGHFIGDIRFDSTILGVGGIVLEVGSGSNEVILAGDYLLVPQLSSFQGLFSSINANEIYAPSISSQQLDIDGQVLTANPTELLLNGVPIATQSSLSTIADWSLDPAISSVNMAGFDLLSTSKGVFSSIFSDSAVFGDISTNTLTVQSTIHVISTISSSVLEAEIGNFSTLNAGSISTPSLFVSSINGAEFTSTSINVQVAGVSSLVANTISSIGAELQEALVSTLQFNPSFSPSLDVNLGLGSLFGNLAGAASGAIGVVVGGAALGTGIAALNQSRQTNYINSNAYELVNGTTQLQISTLGVPFSTVYRFVSSVSETTPGEEYFISTIHSPGVAIRSLSDPLNTVSSPTSTIQSFGQWVALDANLPIPSTVSSFAQLFTSSLAASTMVAQAGSSGIGVRGGAPYLNSASGVSTLEVFETGAPQYSGALRANQVNFSYAGLTSNDFSQDVLLYNYGSNLRLATASSNIVAYLRDIPAVPGTVSSFQDLGTNDLRVSTINMEGTGNIFWDNGASIYEVAAGRLYITAGTTNIDMEPNQITFFEGGGGGQMRFFDNTLEISAISTNYVNVGGSLSSQQTFVSSLNGGIPYTTANPPPVAATVSTFNTASISSATISSINGGIPFTTANPPTIFDTSSILVSSIGSIGNVSSVNIVPNSIASLTIDSAGRFIEIGRNFNLQAQSTGTLLAELLVDSASGGGNGSFRLAGGVGNINASTIAMSTNQLQVNTISSSAVALSNLSFAGISTVSFSTLTAAGTQSQPPGRLGMFGCDLDAGGNDIWCNQIRVGAGQASAPGTAEVSFYDITGARVKGLLTGSSDTTIRISDSSVPGVNSPGYLLDTRINPPFFSTLNATSTALMAYFPSTSASTIGVSTISIIPVSFQASSAFDNNILTSSLTTAAQCIVSTTITVNAPSQVIAQANTTVTNLVNQEHTSYAYLVLNGGTSPSTVTTAFNKIGASAGQAIAFRQALSTGTHTVALYMYADANSVLNVTQCDTWAVGNMA